MNFRSYELRARLVAANTDRTRAVFVRFGDSLLSSAGSYTRLSRNPKAFFYAPPPSRWRKLRPTKVIRSRLTPRSS